MSLLDKALTSTDDGEQVKPLSPDPAHPASPRWALRCPEVAVATYRTRRRRIHTVTDFVLSAIIGAAGAAGAAVVALATMWFLLR